MPVIATHVTSVHDVAVELDRLSKRLSQPELALTAQRWRQVCQRFAAPPSQPDWEDLPGGHQLLCYNEIATKLNWHYLRLGFDLGTMAFAYFQCNDRHFDVSEVEPMRMPAMANLWCMLNVAFWAEAGTDKRAFLYLDSVMLSAENPPCASA